MSKTLRNQELVHKFLVAGGQKLTLGMIAELFTQASHEDVNFARRDVYASLSSDLSYADYIDAIKIVGYDVEAPVGPSWSEGEDANTNKFHMYNGAYSDGELGSSMENFLSALIHLIKLTGATDDDLLMVKYTIKNTFKYSNDVPSEDIPTWGIVREIKKDIEGNFTLYLAHPYHYPKVDE